MPHPFVVENQFAEEYPFESRFLDLDGHQYHYVDEGTGEPILFVHGNPTWSFAWRNLIKKLSPNHRCLAVDHMGCGLSDKPQLYDYNLSQHMTNLTRFIEQLDLSRITLVVHDWGGAIGLGVASSMPERFQQLIITNTAAFRSKLMPRRIAACRIPVLGSLGVRGLNLFARAAIKMAVENRNVMTPEVVRGYLAPYNTWQNRIAVDRFVKDIPMKKTHPSYSNLMEVEQGLSKLSHLPTLLVWGMQDWCFTPHFLREFQERMPHAQTVELTSAGHYLFEDDAEAMTQHLLEAVNR